MSFHFAAEILKSLLLKKTVSPGVTHSTDNVHLGLYTLLFSLQSHYSSYLQGLYSWRLNIMAILFFLLFCILKSGHL